MSNITRRQFMKSTAVIGAASALSFPKLLRAQGLNEKLQVGFVAVGGRAGAHTDASHKAGLQCVAFAEVDKSRWNGVHGKEGWEQAKGYTDWRKVFQNHAEEIDVVFVATPDHSHFAPSMTAVSMGIHCYTEKPLTWSVREAQLLAAFDQLAAGDAPRHEKRASSRPVQLQRTGLGVVTGLVLLAVLVLAIWWWRGDPETATPAPVDDVPGAVDASAVVAPGKRDDSPGGDR